MANEPVNYEAVLADLEAKKSELERAIATIRGVMGLAATGPADPTKGGPGGGGGHPVPEGGDFLGMSIPEATKAHLIRTRKPLSTKAIMSALERGGLPPSKYATVYGVLRRRSEQVGDLFNMNGDWALTEWYPNHRKAQAAAKPDEQPKEKEGPAKKEAKEQKAAG
jgi:hypothetical protein